MTMIGCVTTKTAFVNANIYGNSSHDAILVQNGKIAALGNGALIKSRADRVVDLHNAFVMPGFIEAHAHLLGVGQSKLTLDLRGLSPDAIVALVAESASSTAPGTWIKGRGWDQNLWVDKQFPHQDWLRDIPHPAYLRRVDGHAVWLNDKAMQIANIDDNTVSPTGGEIIRDQNGKATGVLIDNAIELVNKFVNKPDRKELENYLAVGIKEAHRYGITSFHDAGVSRDALALFEDYARNNRLPLRIYAFIDGDDQHLVDSFLERGPIYVNNFLSIRGIKYFADGALGSRGAFLLEHYHDQPNSTGLQLIHKLQLVERTKRALAAGFQVATHAIGDGANRLVLDAYQEALAEVPAHDARLRVEHAQLVDRSDHDRFKQLSVIASMQPTHCTSDMAWVADRIGFDRMRDRAYPWRSLLDAGAKLAFGSDAPVENINPLLGLYAAITRKDVRGYPEDGFMPEQKLTFEEALDGYHASAAFAEFNEHQKGAIKEGFLADFAVFDEDILRIPVSDLLDETPIMTIVGGEIVYERP